jgi:hypothetical protein
MIEDTTQPLDNIESRDSEKDTESTESELSLRCWEELNIEKKGGAQNLIQQIVDLTDPFDQRERTGDPILPAELNRISDRAMKLHIKEVAYGLARGETEQFQIAIKQLLFRGKDIQGFLDQINRVLSHHDMSLEVIRAGRTTTEIRLVNHRDGSSTSIATVPELLPGQFPANPIGPR